MDKDRPRHAADLFPRRADLSTKRPSSRFCSGGSTLLLDSLDAPGEVIFVDDGSETQRDRDRGQGARRSALPAHQAVAQFRPSDRDHHRARSRRRPRGHRHGRRSAGPAGSRPRDDRQMEGGLRRRLRGARVAPRRKPLQADDRRSLLSPHRRARAKRRFRATPATSAWSTARRSTASSPCPSATGSCAACSPGSGSAREP